MSDYTQMIKFGVLCGLCLQNCLHSLLTRYSRSIIGEKWSTYEAVMMAEFLKLCVSSYLSIMENERYNENILPENKNGSAHHTQYRGINRLIWLIWSGKKVIVLVLGYVVSNLFAYVALSRVDASVYTVLGQLKLFTTAAFSMCFLQTIFSGAKLRALVLLAVGCVLVTSPNFNPTSDDCEIVVGNATDEKKVSTMDTFIGVSACLVMVVISGAASVYFEKMLKKDELNLSIWERNVQLAFYSWIIVTLVCGYNYIPKEYFGQDTSTLDIDLPMPFQGWSYLTIAIVILQAVGGILVAVTLKYADAIVKNFAVSGSIILSTFIGYIWLDGVVDMFVLLGCIATILALFNYALDATPNPNPNPVRISK